MTNNSVTRDIKVLLDIDTKGKGNVGDLIKKKMSGIKDNFPFDKHQKESMKQYGAAVNEKVVKPLRQGLSPALNEIKANRLAVTAANKEAVIKNQQLGASLKNMRAQNSDVVKGNKELQYSLNQLRVKYADSIKHVKEQRYATAKGKFAFRRYSRALLSAVFLLRQLSRALGGFIKRSTQFYVESTTHNDDITRSINKMKTAWDFFRFSMVKAMGEAGVFDYIKEKIVDLVNWFNSLDQEQKEFFAKATAWTFVGSKILEVAAQIGVLVLALGRAGVTWKKLKAIGLAASKKLKAAVLAVSKVIMMVLKVMLGAIKTIVLAVSKGIAVAIKAILGAIKTIVVALSKGVAVAIKVILGVIKTIVVALSKFVVGFLKGIVVIAKVIGGFFASLGAGATAAFVILAGLLVGWIANWEDTKETIKGIVKNLMDTAMSFFNNWFAGVKDIVFGIVDMFSGDFKGGIIRVIRGLGTIFLSFTDGIYNLFYDVFSGIIDLVIDAVNGIIGMLNRLPFFDRNKVSFRMPEFESNLAASFHERMAGWAGDEDDYRYEDGKIVEVKEETNVTVNIDNSGKSVMTRRDSERTAQEVVSSVANNVNRTTRF